ncbi:type IV pilin protein [Desulfuromonas acetexigens]|uniref:Prepilin-type N-terminal cleavage/methylation domain-containing protein n=1 Tax=Trichloromonas acetexigens TaxID=38815 RepID=A0A550J8M1_9BACT|nr:prepilin-type N-terminal cleavage/methylation domain-containing protein [Desulfuromonas acetexigens]TRO79473.1 prepilin-type N-terminal cleavage/methylation domain-containing protein [Desulfuromonas acetexigens]
MRIIKCLRHLPRGFTLVELLIVMTVIGILASISVPSYKRSLIKARETVLMEDLYQIRRATDAYYADHAAYPESLEDLINKRYLRGVPRDPFTNESEWECIPPEATDDGELAPGGCYDFRSVSDLVGLNGIPYNEW